jgi:tetratricopeptide (TPR) repeat protein
MKRPIILVPIVIVACGLGAIVWILLTSDRRETIDTRLEEMGLTREAVRQNIRETRSSTREEIPDVEEWLARGDSRTASESSSTSAGLESNPSIRVSFDDFVENGLQFSRDGFAEEMALLAKTARESGNPRLLAAAGAIINISDRETALDLLRQAIRDDPDYLRSYYKLGSLLLGEDASTAEFYEVIEKMKEKDPGNGLVHMMTAIRKFKDGDPEAGLAEFERAVSSKRIANYHKQELLASIQLLRNAGYSEGPAKFSSLMNTGMDLGIGLSRHLRSGVEEQARLRRGYDLEGSIRLLEGQISLGDRFDDHHNSFLSNMITAATKGNPLLILKEIYEEEGMTEKAREVEKRFAELETLQQRIKKASDKLKAIVQAVGSFADEKVFIDYIDSVILLGELEAIESITEGDVEKIRNRGQ